MPTTYPFPPPTTNTLEPAQRKQLLKSTQKLSALLGTTPRVFELESDPKAFRREGKVFYNQSASSSRTSLSSYDTESFLWISPSPDILSRRHHKTASSPIAIEFPRAKSRRAVPSAAGHRKSKSSHHQRSTPAPVKLSQPLFYRLRSLPSPPPIVPPLITDEKVTPSSNLLATRTRTNSTLKPSGKKELSESDRRRKIAKLARTFGENVPPELVFGQLPRSNSFAPNSAATTTATATTAEVDSPSCISRRTRSTSAHHLITEPASRSNSKDLPPVPALPQKDDLTSKFPPQTPIITITTITTDENGTVTTTSKRKRRPRSLTLTHIPMGQRKGIIIEQDIQLQPVRRIGRQPSRSLDEPDRRFNTYSKDIAATSTNLVDHGYRKERDWSGEWNVKDMQEVVSTLRCLRVR